jgi:hypothetical protein
MTEGRRPRRCYDAPVRLSALTGPLLLLAGLGTACSGSGGGEFLRADARPDDGLDGGSTALCPPSGTPKRALGEILPNASLRTCEGEVFELHQLCERKAAWLFVYADW